MPTISRQRSPRRQDFASTGQAASRLHKSASVPRLSLHPPTSTSQPQPPQQLRPQSATLRNVGKHLLFPLSEAPYPISYHREAMTCDALDHFTLKTLYNSCTILTFPDGTPPKRSLDLGCGSGAWIVEAANEWPDCVFVGFDIVDVQMPTHRLPPKIARRISWVHGNFLKPLPFDDGSFDHVHIRHIARGVPEDKWDFVISEVSRVLATNGNLEIFEEDIIFPVLPRSCTAQPRARRRQRSPSIPIPPTKRPLTGMAITTHIPQSSLPEHDHYVLETLFYRLFERRFINLQPTALIMGWLNIHLRHAAATPLINFPLPPAPELEDPNSDAPSNSSSRSTTPRISDQRRSIIPVLPPIPPTPPPVPPLPTSRRMTTSSICSSSSSSSPCTSLPTSPTSTFITTPASSVADLQVHPDPTQGPIAFFSDSVTPGKDEVLSEDKLKYTEGTLSLNLYRSWQGVMVCREAIWVEYEHAAAVRDPLLDNLEWEEHELAFSGRQKFDALMERYRRDMFARHPLGASINSSLHWHDPYPYPSKVSSQEEEEEKAKKKALFEARHDALRLERSGIGALPEGKKICRKGRLFIARKGRVAEPNGEGEGFQSA